MRDPVAEIVRYNRRFAGRYPAVVRRKLRLLAENPFVFFRGTFHLFAADWAERRFDPWPDDAALNGEEIRIVGDLHGENFGTYGGPHHTALYDLNDFDDCSRGRLDFDLCRAAASLLLGQKEGAARAFIEAYLAAPARPAPAIRRLIHSAEEARRPEFIRRITGVMDGRRRFQRGDRTFDLRPVHRAQAVRLLEDYVRRAPGRSGGRYDLLDVCGRIAGVGSLGRLRYAVLTAGEDPDDARNLILEFKESLPSALDDARGRKAAARMRAQEVEAATRAFQAKPDPYLGHAVDDGASFQVRQIGPRQMRLDWSALPGEQARREVAVSLGGLLAAAHRRANPGAVTRLLRASTAGRPESFVRRVLSFALAYAEQVESDWRRYVSQRSRVERELMPAGKARS